jgi:hypothetical protein
MRKKTKKWRTTDMGSQRITIDSPEVAKTLDGRIEPMLNNDPALLDRVAEFLRGIASGAYRAIVRVNSGAVMATNNVNFASFVQNDTVTLNGVQLTGKDSPTTGAARVQFRTGVSDEDTANDLRSLIVNSSVNKIVGVVTAKRRATVQCTSVVATNTLVINGVTFTVSNTPTAGTPESVKTGTSDAVMAKNFANAIAKSTKIRGDLISVSVSSDTLTIDYYGALTISATGGTMTVTSKTVVIDCIVPGQIGNLCTLAISAHGTVTGANFASGTEGTQSILNTHRTIL